MREIRYEQSGHVRLVEDYHLRRLAVPGLLRQLVREIRSSDHRRNIEVAQSIHVDLLAGSHVAGRDIGLDPLLAANAVIMSDLSGHEVESGLFDAAFVKSRNEADRALIGREESPAAARNVIESEGDALLSLCSRPADGEE